LQVAGCRMGVKEDDYENHCFCTDDHCRDGVFVTGGVIDIRPYIAFANLVTAPLRIARGIQNKVLEAMAMAKPVLATHDAMDGIATSFDNKTNEILKSYTSNSAEELALTNL